MNVVPMVRSKETALNVIESLRRDVESGKVVCFACVGISSDDATLAYVGFTEPVSRLRLIGAMTHFTVLYNEGKE